MIYVYALIDNPADVISGRGLEDQPLEVVKYRELGAIISLHEGSRIMPTAENAWRHEQVVEACMPGHAVLPARFGTFFESTKAVELVLAERYERILDAARRLKGLVEIGVRVVRRAPPLRAPLTDDATFDGLTGREYLQLRLANDQDRREAEAVAQRINAPLQLLAIDASCRVGVDDRTLLAAAYLVAPQRIDEIASRATELVSDNPDLLLACTGPWPAYNFMPDLATDLMHT
jgi:hypothetical protein